MSGHVAHALGLTGALCVALLGVNEIIEGVAARSSIWSHARRPSDRGVVVVLGFGDSGSRAGSVNRWRARMALRSARIPGTARIVTSGGAVRGAVPEALLLADHLRRELGWTGPIITEPTSRSTWENVRNAVPLLEDADWIVFASNPLHALKARIYLRTMRPDLARRLIRGREQRIGEMPWLKLVFTALGMVKLIRLARST